MHKDRTIRIIRATGWVALVALLAGWVAYVVWSRPGFQKCIAESENAEYGAHIEDRPQKLRPSKLFFARIDTACTGDWFFDNREAFTAIATIFMGFFTLTLWRSTEKLWGEAKLSGAAAKRAADAARDAVETDRAWMIPNGVNCMPGRDSTVDGVHYQEFFVFGPKWINCGRTPALQTAIVIRYILAPYEAKVPEVELDWNRVENASGMCGPNGEFHGENFGVGGDNYNAFVGRRMKLFVFSSVRYVDIFKPKTIRISKACWEVIYNGVQVDRTGSQGPNFQIGQIGPHNSAT
jgi:hypothetical protein